MQQRVREMRTGGTTSFTAAFNKVKEILFGDTSGGRVTRRDYAPGTPEFEEQRRLGRQGLLVQACNVI